MLSIGVTLSGQRVAATLATPRERQTDAAMAAQDAATEAQSDGLRARPTALDHLRARPGLLDRFAD